MLPAPIPWGSMRRANLEMEEFPTGRVAIAATSRRTDKFLLNLPPPANIVPGSRA
jgi:hypothetical protein